MVKLKPREVFAPFRGRDKIGIYLQEQNLNGVGVEVGTHRGKFAKCLLETSRLEKLYCVDPYQNGYDDTDPASRGDREADKQIALDLLKPFGARAQMLFMPSAKAGRQFNEGRVDFVYLDGCHQPESIREDLTIWWSKLKPGGGLAGHDIICPGAKSRGGLGWGRYIRPLVNQFARLHESDVYIVRDSHSYWSYYLVKT